MARGGHIGSKVSLPESAHFTKKAEISGRDKQTKVLQPTAFKQIGVADNPSMNVASKSMARKGGAIKFSNFSG